ncbi:MAG: hypothetical protein KJN76_02795 [Eudoraea sp.]|nr:hypothetical protein [Eudoraea sp.]
MAPPEPNIAEKSKSNFPYKTLIWATFALIAIFLFRGPIADLLIRANEVSVFGIELKVGEAQAAKLEIAIQSYKDQIDGFSEQVTQQQEQIQNLEILKGQLEEDIAGCPDAKESTEKLNIEFTRILEANNDLKIRSDVLKDTKILQRMNKGELKVNGQ